MIIHEQVFYDWIANFVFVFTRLSAGLISAPVVGTQLVPVRIQIILIALITFVALPMVHRPYSYDLLSTESIVILFQQFFIGFGMGLSLQIVMQVFILLGEIVAMQSGLGFAILNDPASKSSVPMVSQLYLMLVTLLFLAFDGHLMLMRIIVESFSVFPIQLQLFGGQVYYDIANLVNWMFISGFTIALPAITALMMVNAAFGVMTRSAPQLNIFSIGFPITMILGVVIIWANIGIVHGHFSNSMEYISTFLNHHFLGVQLDGT